MKTLLEKEGRLLLPAFAAALALAILPVWFLPLGTFERGGDGALEGYLFLLGIGLLALSSFGREISLKTTPFALAQPIERSRIWWIKVEVLAVFLAVTFDAWLISATLCSSFQAARVVPPDALALCALALIVLTAGVLWLTLLLRQVVAALMLAVLIPTGVAITIQAFGGEERMIITFLAVYSAVGFFLAWRQFLHLQDTAWTGGTVSFGRGRAGAEQSALREHNPWRALLRKELQLQQFTLAGMAALFVLHLGVIMLRVAGAHTFNHALLSAMAEFWVVWFFAPMLAGSQSVAEERQLGTLDPLLCLPMSRRAQFGVKLIMAILIGGVLGANMLCAAEAIGRAMGAGAVLSVMGGSQFLHVTFGFMGIALLGFYGSTLTRGLVPALATGTVLTVLCWICLIINFSAFAPPALSLLAPLTLVMTILWLAWGNFRWVFESGRRWRRNIFGLVAAIGLACGAATALYYRVWQWAMPLESAHGPARLPVGKLALLRTEDSVSVRDEKEEYRLAAVLPDGRLWVQRKVNTNDLGWKDVENQFVKGSNWLNAVSRDSSTVGIQSDGTLWVSTNGSQIGELVQFGSENGWQSMAPSPFHSVVLLRRDGTFWNGESDQPRQNPAGMGSFSLHRLGPDSDWTQICPARDCVYAWKKDGSAWSFHAKGVVQGPDIFIWSPLQVDIAPGIVAVRVPALDHNYFRSITRYPGYRAFERGEIGLRDDGTLWYWDDQPEWSMTRDMLWRRGGSTVSAGLVQIGHDSNWASVGGFRLRVLALKSDGSLWQWKIDPSQEIQIIRVGAPIHPGTLPEPLQKSAVRLGTSSDWVALAAQQGNPVTLAADGSLWRWPSPLLLYWDEYPFEKPGFWLGPSRRPVQIETIPGAQK